MMKKVLYVLLACSVVHNIDSTTLVYNMKIRRAFAAGSLLNIKQKKQFAWLLTALPIYYQRTRQISVQQLSNAIHEKTRSGGSIFNARLLAPYHWWAEVVTGLEKQTTQYAAASNTQVSRTGFDDIVISIGKNFFFAHDNGQAVVYGIAGFPAYRAVSEADQFDPQVGTRVFGLGVGGEVSYSFIKQQAQALIGIIQTRFVHFFNRRWAPILPCDARIQPGNITDLVLLLQYRKKKNVIEVGYNPTFFTDQAVLLPAQTIKTDTFVRNSVYANYLLLFERLPLIKMPGGLGAGINIGRANRFDTKIFACWLNVTVLV
jgi:hypothetical protein